MSWSKFFFNFFILVLISACTKKQAENTSPPSPLAEKGRGVYMTYCTSCHNPDPKKDGSLGPAVWGSSQDLLETRVIKGGYPTGYSPKRASKTMVPLPQLKNEIEALHAFLNN